MQLSRIDLADIHAPRRLAEAVHAQVGPLCSAVPVDRIATALDIGEVRLDTFDGFEGMLLTDDARSRGAILANIRYGGRRARFTMAHELGHFLLERHVLSAGDGFRCKLDDLTRSGGAGRHARQEIEANTFAIELLAPPGLVDPLLSDDPELRDGQRMRDALDLSLEACLRRMIDRRPEPLGVVFSHGGRVRYVIRGRGFPFITCSKSASLPPTTLAFRTTSAGRSGFTTFAETHGGAWTDRPDMTLFEQTRLAENGHAVTLLWANLPEDADDEDEELLPELGQPRFR